MGDFDLAMEYADKALDKNPDNLLGLARKFHIYMENNDYSSALKIINKCIELESILPSLIHKYSLIADLGRYEDSLNGFEQIPIKEFDDWAIIHLYYFHYGYALGLMGKAFQCTHSEKLKLCSVGRLPFEKPRKNPNKTGSFGCA